MQERDTGKAAISRDKLRAILIASIGSALSVSVFLLFMQGAGPSPSNGNEVVPWQAWTALALMSVTTLAVTAYVDALTRRTPRLEREMAQRAKELEAANATIRDSELRSRTLLETVADGIVTIDERGTVEMVNPAIERMFGYDAAELVGRNVRALMPEPYRREHDGYLHRYVETGEARIIGNGREVEGIRKDGSIFPIDLAVSEMWLGTTRLFTGVVRDIGDRKQAQRAKSEFVSVVSHELRTPLTSINGALGLIKSGSIGDLPEQLSLMLDIAHNNCARLIRLINDILDVEKIESGKMVFKMALVDLADLIDEAVDANRTYGRERNVELIVMQSVRNAPVYGDFHRLMQVMANLISNAVKFSPAGGEVRVGLVRMSNRFRISVSDDGPGIESEFQERIFQKFSQLDSSNTREGSGTGLGLAISQAIVNQHRGAIAFESAPGSGSIFYFDLPEAEQAAARNGNGENRAHESSALNGGNGRDAARILICSDRPRCRASVRRILENAGYSTSSMGSSEAQDGSLDRLKSDLIVLDGDMSDELAGRLLDRFNDDPAGRFVPRVLLTTGLSAEDSMDVDGRLPPDADREQLLAKIESTLAAQRRRQKSILHVENDRDVGKIVSALLSDLAHVANVKTVRDGKVAIRKNQYDLVILDLLLPDGDGSEILDELVFAKRHKTTPVVIYSVKEPHAHDLERENVRAGLLKSQTSNDELVASVRQLLETNAEGWPHEAA